MRSSINNLISCILIGGLLLSCPGFADPVGSSFSYSGRLTDNDVPASGAYDIEFALYTVADGGNAVDVSTSSNLIVKDGILNANLDFTDVPYDGEALWIEVRVRSAGASGGYTALSPRQPIAAAPYALYALNGPSVKSGSLATQHQTPASVQPQDASSWTLPYMGTTSAGEGSPAAAFSIIESGSSFAIYGQSSNAGGVRGVSMSANGVRGDSTTGNGVYGSVAGGSGSTVPLNAGVVGDSATGPGIHGLSKSANGVRGDSVAGNGVYGISLGGSGAPISTGSGVIGDSAGDGVEGFSSGGGNSGVYGKNIGGGKGVFGASDTGQGVAGGSTSGYGLFGSSSSGSGVYGQTAGASGASGAAGVWGNSHNYFGVWGTSVSADGVHGQSTTSSGVYGISGGAGVWGESTGYDGLHGHTTAGTASGVAGFNDANGAGVFGSSVSGDGVYGHSNSGYGMVTDGSSTQARNQGGWVKAMVLVNPFNEQIVRCFNSQLPANQASSPPCGFSLQEPYPGYVIVNFGFEVDDRFFAALPFNSGSDGHVGIEIEQCATLTSSPCDGGFPSQNQVRILTFDLSGAALNAYFSLIVL